MTVKHIKIFNTITIKGYKYKQYKQCNVWRVERCKIQKIFLYSIIFYLYSKILYLYSIFFYLYCIKVFMFYILFIFETHIFIW